MERKHYNICSIDIETFSEADLKKTGVYAYAEHPSTQLLCLAYSFDGGPVNLWVPYRLPAIAHPTRLDGALHLGAIPDELFDHMFAGRECRAHNAQFERVVLNGIGERHGLPPTGFEQWRCTMVKCSYYNILADLKSAAMALGTHPKDDAGHGVMLQLCRPRKPSKDNPETRWTVTTAPDKYRHLFNYCIDDVRAEQGIDEALPDIPAMEQAAYVLDQRINARGVQVDVASVKRVLKLRKEHVSDLEAECAEVTGGIEPNQTMKLAEWIRAQGVDIPDLQMPTLTEYYKNKSLPKRVREAIRIRALCAMKAPAKYDAMLKALCRDRAIRGMFVFYAASTGRWSSRIVQLQNLHRGYIKDPQTAIDAYEREDLEWLRTLYDIDPIKVFASTIRGMLVAREGHDILPIDFSQIEARVAPWLADEQDMLNVFRAGKDPYVHTATRIYKTTEKAVDSRMRFVGKVSSLSCQFGGAVGAYTKMARNYGVEVSEEDAQQVVNDWRQANQRIVDTWYVFDKAARNAINRPGAVFPVCQGRAAFRSKDINGRRFLMMRLPSGRILFYYKPFISEDGQISYIGIDTFTRKWGPTRTYGASMFQSAVQAIARDLMVNGMFKLSEAEYPLIGTVHDEIWTEPMEGFGSLEQAAALMCDVPAWADGLPVTAAGFRAKRYRKD